jgi:type IV pilus assembly protein PilM
MASGNVCWGIELGAGGLKALKLARDGDDVRVLEFVDLQHKRVLSAPDLDVNEAYRLAISTFVGQYDLSGSQVAISVPGHSAFARFAKLPPVEPKKVKDIVKFEAVQQIPFQLSEVEWDYQTFASPDSPDVEVGIFAMTREKVMERLALWAEAGVTPDIVTLSPVAAYNAVAYDQSFSEKTPGTVILDVGTTSTDLIVAEPGRMWIRTFPIGGHQFTEALVSAFKLSYLKAEKLKREAEASKHARHVFQAMRPVFSDLAQEVQRSIGYYQSLHKDANLTRLIGLGSTFTLPGLRKYLSQQLQMEVVRLERFSRLSLDGPRSGEFAESTPRLATAYGLALQGVGLDTCTANLMPTAVIKESMWRRKVPWFGLAAGLAIIGAGASFYRYFVDKQAAAAAKPAIIEQVKGQITSLGNEWRKVNTPFADFRAANAVRLLDRRDLYAFILDDFGHMMHDARAKALAAGAAEGSSRGLGYLFRKFNTVYIPGDAGSAANPAAPARAPRARRGASGSTVAVQQTGETRPRIGIEITVSTTQEKPIQFVRDTVVEWLRQNADRKDVPYTYDPTRVTVTQTGQEKIPEDAKPAAPPPGGDEGPPGLPPPGGGLDHDRRGGGGGKGGAGLPPMGEGIQPPPMGEGGMMPPLGSPGAGGANLGQLAPLPKPPPIAEPGSTVTTLKVYFEAVLRGDQPADATRTASAATPEGRNP